MRVLLTGATGFVGRHTVARLLGAGHEVVGASRSPRTASADAPHLSWVRFDVEGDEPLAPTLDGFDALIYLVHATGGPDYHRREVEAARRLAKACGTAGVGRIVYLGALAPLGLASTHLAARLDTGRALREGPVPVVELGASMIVGPGSQGWKMVRDAVLRLPILACPPWLRFETEPIAIEDVARALTAALEVEATGRFSLPGPERMSGRTLLSRVAATAGHYPRIFDVPVGPRKLIGRLVARLSGGDPSIAHELLDDYRSDIVCAGDSFWEVIGSAPRVSFDEAARRAHAIDLGEIGLASRVAERLVRRSVSREGR